MSRDILILPTFDRPEMLWLCLKHIVKCPESLKMKVLVRADAHVGTYPPVHEIEEVLGKFPQLDINFKVREPHTYHGNSYNVLVSYAESLLYGMGLVFMVEDDVVVSPDFFKWHYRQHKSASSVVSVGVKPPKDHRVYASLGVCFRAAFLAKLVSHANPSYFGDMRGYCEKRFPPSIFDCEQDGLIARMLVQTKVEAAWPEDEPVAQHIGWYGYHRQKSLRPVGTVEERFQKLQSILNTPELLKHYNFDFPDIEPLQDFCCN